MPTLLEEYLDRLEGLHTDLRQAIAGLSQEAFDWIPGPEMNSLGILLAHTAGSQRYWIGTVAGNDSEERDRDAEFRTTDLDESAFAAQLDAVLAHSRATLEALAQVDLQTMRFAPKHDREFTAAWAILHALEHTATHVGHIQLTRQLWDQHHEKSS